MVEWTPEMWVALATVVGFNTPAEQQTTLGGKVFCRMGRDLAEKELIKLGGEVKMNKDVALITIRGVPDVVFTKSDIELMRKCVADYDKENSNG